MPAIADIPIETTARNLARRRRLSRTRRYQRQQDLRTRTCSNASRSRFCCWLAGAVPVMAQDWPAKQVKIMVPFGAGSTPDIVARIIADGLRQEISRQRLPRREQAGRQRQSRHRRGRQSRARRRDHRHQHRRPARHQHAAVFEAALRSAQGHRADHPAHHAAERARGQSGAQGQSVAELVALLKSASRANTISPRSATARCRSSPWRRSRSKSGTKIVHVPYQELAATP